MSVPQVYRCPDCGFQFGPVGTLPVTSQQVQFLVVCRPCRKTSAITAPPGPLRATCACGAADWEALGACPACASTQAGWTLT